MAILDTTTVEARNAHGWVRLHVSDQGSDRVAQLTGEIDGTTISVHKSVKSRFAKMELLKMLPLLQDGLNEFRRVAKGSEVVTLTIHGEKNGHRYSTPAFDLSVNESPGTLLFSFRKRLDTLTSQAK